MVLNYTQCFHDPIADKVISAHISWLGSKEPWEIDFSRKLLKMAQNYGDPKQKSINDVNLISNSKVIVLDIGANIGPHTLFLASAGFDVWAVEPLNTNVVKV